VPVDALTGPVKVFTPGGATVSTNNVHVFPHLTDFTPRWAPTGAVVRITGTSLQQASAVAFGGVPAPLFSILSATELQATVPAGAQSGPIEVTTPDGTAVSSNRFVVTGAADLRLRFDSWTDWVAPGDPVAYRVQAVNLGPPAAGQVTLVYQLPAGMVFESAYSDHGVWTFTNQTVTCEVGILEPSEEVSVTVAGAFPQEGVFLNTASVSAEETDPDVLSNQASVSTIVVSDRSRTLAVDGMAGGSQVRVSWPTSAVPFTLQAAPGLSSTNAWSRVTNTPSVTDGHNRVTNPVTGESRFYRLRGP
jgi:uncharacterized repeat protein (TIGR01451 family)